MKNFLISACVLLSLFNINHTLAKSDGIVDLSYYLPLAGEEKTNYRQDIPTPQAFLGYQVGEWHVRPEQIESYFRRLAELSPRFKVKTYAHSYEKRPLILAYISSEENITNLETIRQQHLKMEKNTDRPAVVWMGYSVHGNEASGSNASLLLAYHLAAATDPETVAQLESQVIIIDPMLNPDGLARFAQWANGYRSRLPNSDPATREHNEAWPYGRTNHYWFDLNRDWLLLQHPESRGRVEMFHQWKPNVLTDFHEMGTNSTYFFQPGVKSRQNPLTPKENFDLTAKIATYHAKALDDIGSLYFSKENFDDFYYGKGSTYPDINGSVGILFEQASARGHLQQSVNGDVSFPFAVRNQLTTSFSTLKAVQENRKELLAYQRNFYARAKIEAKASRNRAVVYSSTDPYRIREFNRILEGHQIESFPLNRELEVDNVNFSVGQSYIVPMRQEQSRLIEAIFEKREQFEDNTFYDVSSWTLPLAFDIDYKILGRSDFAQSLIGAKNKKTQGMFEGIDNKTVALTFDWRDFSSASLLSFLQQHKLLVRLVGKEVVVETSKGNQTLRTGDLILPIRNQEMPFEQLNELLMKKLNQLSIVPLDIRSGLAVSGPDLGSPSFPPLKQVKPLMLIGDGVSSYQAGEVWHLLDQRLDQELSMMTIAQLSRFDIEKYTHIIMVDGRYNLDKSKLKKLDEWVKSGGILITQSGASKWLAKLDWLSSKIQKLDTKTDTSLRYEEMDHHRAEHYIGGAIASTTIDLSHPLAYGLGDSQLAIFKRGQFSFTEPKESFVSVARFNKKPLHAGYMSNENKQNLANKTSILVQGRGKGKLIAFTDDMNFRAFWLGSSRVFANALYFGKIIDAPQKKKESQKNKESKK
ncbi:MAG: hypothetical protein KUG78_21195 [Kangiellaceae bacterium]|nr:hypothetical protein [Kangiellaceae bacterium]